MLFLVIKTGWAERNAPVDWGIKRIGILFWGNWVEEKNKTPWEFLADLIERYGSSTVKDKSKLLCFS